MIVIWLLLQNIIVGRSFEYESELYFNWNTNCLTNYLNVDVAVVEIWTSNNTFHYDCIEPFHRIETITGPSLIGPITFPIELNTYLFFTVRNILDNVQCSWSIENATLKLNEKTASLSNLWTIDAELCSVDVALNSGLDINNCGDVKILSSGYFIRKSGTLMNETKSCYDLIGEPQSLHVSASSQNYSSFDTRYYDLMRSSTSLLPSSFITNMEPSPTFSNDVSTLILPSSSLLISMEDLDISLPTLRLFTTELFTSSSLDIVIFSTSKETFPTITIPSLQISTTPSAQSYDSFDEYYDLPTSIFSIDIVTSSLLLSSSMQPSSIFSDDVSTTIMPSLSSISFMEDISLPTLVFSTELFTPSSLDIDIFSSIEIYPTITADLPESVISSSSMPSISSVLIYCVDMSSSESYRFSFFTTIDIYTTSYIPELYYTDSISTVMPAETILFTPILDSFIEELPSTVLNDFLSKTVDESFVSPFITPTPDLLSLEELPTTILTELEEQSTAFITPTSTIDLFSMEELPTTVLTDEEHTAFITPNSDLFSIEELPTTIGLQDIFSTSAEAVQINSTPTPDVTNMLLDEELMSITDELLFTSTVPSESLLSVDVSPTSTIITSFVVTSSEDPFSLLDLLSSSLVFTIEVSPGITCIALHPRNMGGRGDGRNTRPRLSTTSTHTGRPHTVASIPSSTSLPSSGTINATSFTVTATDSSLKNTESSTFSSATESSQMTMITTYTTNGEMVSSSLNKKISPSSNAVKESSPITMSLYSTTDSRMISSSSNQLLIPSSNAVKESSSSITVPPYSIADSQVISSSVNQLLFSSIAVEETSSITVSLYSSQIISSPVNQLLLSSSIAVEESSSITVPPLYFSQIISSSVNQLLLSSSIAVEESSSITVPLYSSQIISSPVNQLLLSSSIAVESSITVPLYSSQIISSSVNLLLLSSSIAVEEFSQMSLYHSTTDSRLVSFSSSLFSSSNIQTPSSTHSSMYSPISLTLSNIDSLSSIIPTPTSSIYIQTLVSVTPSTRSDNLTCEMTDNLVETMAGENATSIGGCYNGAANAVHLCNSSGGWEEVECVVSEQFKELLNLIQGSPEEGLAQLRSEIVAQLSGNNPESITLLQFVYLLEMFATDNIVLGPTWDDSSFTELMQLATSLIANANTVEDSEIETKAISELLIFLDEVALKLGNPILEPLEIANGIYITVQDFEDIPENDTTGIRIGENYITLPNELLDANSSHPVRVVSYFFTNLLTSLTPIKEVNSTIVSPVISSTTNCTSCSFNELQDNVTIQLRVENLSQRNGVVSCVYFEFEKNDQQEVTGGDWSTDGCTTIVDGNIVTCSCNHLTHFAILLSPGIDKIDPIHFVILSNIGQSLVCISLLCMVAVILTFSLMRSLWSIRNYIHIMLCVSLFVAQLVFIIGIDKIKNEGACSAIAVILQYLFLVTFMWMLMEGVVLYVTLVRVFIKNHVRYVIGFTVASYVIPAVYMAIVVPIGFLVQVNDLPDDSHYLYYNNGIRTACWLNYSSGFIWSFIVPVAIIIVVNIGFFIMAFVIMRKHSKKQKTRGTTTAVKHWLKASISLTLVMGIAWLTGVLAFRKELLFIAYIMTVFIAGQGILLFIILIPLSKQVREAYTKVWLRWKSQSTMITWISNSTPSFLSKSSTAKTNSSEMKPKGFSGGIVLGTFGSQAQLFVDTSLKTNTITSGDANALAPIQYKDTTDIVSECHVYENINGCENINGNETSCENKPDLNNCDKSVFPQHDVDCQLYGNRVNTDPGRSNYQDGDLSELVNDGGENAVCHKEIEYETISIEIVF